MFLARISLWIFAVFAAILPIAVIVAKPALDVSLLLHFSSYAAIRRDFSLSAIAILAIGFLDASEVMMACKNHPNYNALFFIMWPIIVAILMALIVFSIFCGASGTSDAVTAPLFYMYFFSLVLSFFSRLALVVAP